MVNRYIYNGMRLKDYCSRNNISYYQILNRIRTLAEQGYKCSSTELLDTVLNDEKYYSLVEPSKRYYYNGILLSDYCMEKGISHGMILRRINVLKDEELSDEELVSTALNDDLFYKKSKKFRYLYKGTTLRKYCEENGYDYQKMLRRYKRLKEEYIDLTDEEIYKIVFDEKLYFQSTDKYHYEGISLSKYCEENGIKYHNVIRRMKKNISNNNLELDEAIKESVLHYLDLVKRNRDKHIYLYNDMVLRRYCEENDIDYNFILRRIKKLRKKDDSLSNDDLARIALNDELFSKYMINEYRKNKYCYQGMSLKEYCEKNMLDYIRIKTRMKALREKIDDSEIIETALDDDRYHSTVSERKTGKYYLYKGYTLRKYCKLKKLDYGKVLEEICKIDEKNPEMPNEEIIELAINRQDDDFVSNERIVEIRKQIEQLTNLKGELLSNKKKSKQLVKN